MAIPPDGISESCKTPGLPRVLHDFDTPRVEWPYIQWQPIKEYFSLILVVLCNTDTAFKFVFHGPALSSTGGHERNKYHIIWRRDMHTSLSPLT